MDLFKIIINNDETMLLKIGYRNHEILVSFRNNIRSMESYSEGISVFGGENLDTDLTSKIFGEDINLNIELSGREFIGLIKFISSYIDAYIESTM